MTELLLLAALLLPQEQLGDSIRMEDEEYSIRPQAGWVRVRSKDSHALRLSPPGRDDVSLVVIRFRPQKPLPMAAYAKELDTYLQEKYSGAEFSDPEKAGGIPGCETYRKAVVWSPSGRNTKERVVKNALRRGNRDYYLVDLFCPWPDEEKWGERLQVSLASMQILPREITPENRKAQEEADRILNGGSWAEKLTGEQWQVIQLGSRRAGHQRQKLEKQGETYRFETSYRVDFGDGGSDGIEVKGEFSPDGSYQRMEFDETLLTDKKEKRAYRAKVVLDHGKVRSEREMNGLSETREFTVPPGTLLEEVADSFRRSLAPSEKGKRYGLRVLNPFDEEPSGEFIDATGKERVRLEGQEREVYILQAESGGRFLGYWYGPSFELVRMIVPKSPFLIVGASREEALGTSK